MKKLQVSLIFIICISLMYLNIDVSNEEISYFYPLCSHTESISNTMENIKLTVSINSILLKWDTIFDLKLSLINQTNNQSLLNSKVLIKAYMHQNLYLKLNISIPYYFIYEDIELSNNITEFMRYIPHVPTLLPYLLEVSYEDPSLVEPLSVSFPFLVLSDRKPMISFLNFDTFVISYFIFFFITIIFMLADIKKKRKPR